MSEEEITEKKPLQEDGAKVVEKTTPEVEKKISNQDLINQVAAKVRKEEKEKSEVEKKTLEERLAKIEEERRVEKEQLAIQEKITKQLDNVNKETFLKTEIEKKVNKDFTESIFELVKVSIDLFKTDKDGILVELDKVLSRMAPGVAKGTSNTSNEITKLAANPEVKKLTGEFYTTGGTKLDITLEEYNKMSFPQKESIIKK